jgi:hypothetical protein
MAREASPGAKRMKDQARRATEARRIAAHVKRREQPVPEGVSETTLKYCMEQGIPIYDSPERIGKNGERRCLADLSGDRVVDNMVYNLLKQEGAILKRDEKTNTLEIMWPAGVAEQRRDTRINRHVASRTKFKEMEGEMELKNGEITEGLLEEIDQHLLA